MKWSTLGLTSLALGVLAVIFIVIATAEPEDDGLDRGLGKHISWYTLADGLALAKEGGKPLMLIIHKSWCGACKSLKPKFRDSQKIAKLSQNFVMVNTMDDDEPEGETYKPDGGYIPRILFFDSEGELLKDVVNEGGNPQYKYYYYDEMSIVTSMEKVAALFKADVDDLDANDDTDQDKPVKNEL